MGPDARETRLARRAKCHCNCTKRGVRRKNILGILVEDGKREGAIVRLHIDKENQAVPSERNVLCQASVRIKATRSDKAANGFGGT